MANEKKKLSLGGLDNAAEEKGSLVKTIWQFVKFLVVSGLVTIIQLVLAVLLPYIFDKVTAELPAFLQVIFQANAIFDVTTAEGAADAALYAPNGIVTWGYVLPFLLSNGIANIYGYIQNKKTTFKSDAPTYCFVIYIVLLVSLILFSTWLQAAIVGGLTGLDSAAYSGFLGTVVSLVSANGIARTIASLAAGMVQMLVLFPMEKFVLLKEKKEDKAEA